MTETNLEPKIGDFPFTGECQAGLEALQGWRNRLLDLAAQNPLEALFTVVAGGAMVFYLAERDVNEDVTSYGDALHYISTCLSVGYAKIYPITQTGKLVATIVMAVGPSLSSWLIEGRVVARQAEAAPAAPVGPAAPDLSPVVERLDAILEELRRGRC